MKTCLQLNTSHGTKIPTSLIMRSADNVNSLSTFSHTFQVEMLLHALSLNQMWEKRQLYTIYRVRTQKFESYEKRLASRKAHAPRTRPVNQLTHCCTARTDLQIITQITGSWSMDNSILQHGLERQVTYFISLVRSTQTAAFALSYQ